MGLEELEVGQEVMLKNAKETVFAGLGEQVLSIHSIQPKRSYIGTKYLAHKEGVEVLDQDNNITWVHFSDLKKADV